MAIDAYSVRTVKVCGVDFEVVRGPTHFHAREEDNIRLIRKIKNVHRDTILFEGRYLVRTSPSKVREWCRYFAKRIRAEGFG